MAPSPLPNTEGKWCQHSASPPEPPGSLKPGIAMVAIAIVGLAPAQGSSAGATGTTATTSSSNNTNSNSPLRGVAAYLHTRMGVAQVAVFDELTGKTYRVSDGTDLQYTASIVRVDVLALWLWLYQSVPGTIPSNLPYSIQYLMRNMITMSDNVAATSLFYFSGGCNVLSQFDIVIPTHNTKVGWRRGNITGGETQPPQPPIGISGEDPGL